MALKWLFNVTPSYAETMASTSGVVFGDPQGENVAGLVGYYIDPAIIAKCAADMEMEQKDEPYVDL